jgi:exopolyphosphatase/guanosine-5'-triphosphate,3'-diphosphate pyrophosphatase
MSDMLNDEFYTTFKKYKDYNKYYMKRVAAIDLGSNAIRLTIAEVTTPGHYKILEKFRFPVRVGSDVFLSGEVSESKVHDLLEVFKKFNSYLESYHVQEVRAVATSGLRDAANTTNIVKLIEETTKIKVQIITGLEEANLIYEIVAHELPIMTGKTLLIDIGGGSTELSFINEGHLEKVQSYNVGTVRLLKNYKNDMPELIEAVKTQVTGQKMKIVGTGGNLRRVGKLRKKIFGRGDPSLIHKSEVFEMYNIIKNFSALQLMKKYDLKHDRAEVIVPALQILTAILTDINVDIINLPKVGLSDSLILNMASANSFSLNL